MRWVVLAGAAIILSGCGAQEFFFNKDISLSPGHGQMSDIKQRGVFVQSRPDIDGVSSPVVCAEPSPDAMSAVAASLAARADISDTGSGAFAASVNESVASVGLRTQTIQLLRDGFYRMCEGYMSGALTGEDYSIMQRRYQANMLALLAIEQLTGTVRAPTVALDTSSSARITVLRQELEEATLTYEKHARDLEAARKADPQKPDDIKALDEQVKKDEVKIRSIRDDIRVSGASIAEVELVTRQNQQISKDVSEAVVKIAESVIQKDYAGQMCFEYFRRREIVRNSSGAAAGSSAIVGGNLSTYCSGVFKQNLEAMAVSVNLANACLKFAETLVKKGDLVAAQEQFKLCAGDRPSYPGGPFGSSPAAEVPPPLPEIPSAPR